MVISRRKLAIYAAEQILIGDYNILDEISGLLFV